MRNKRGKISETCTCGAKLEYEGEFPIRMASGFRNAHILCRETYARLAATPTIVVGHTATRPPARDPGLRSI